MVYTLGTARIRHSTSGEVYEIDSNMIDFRIVGTEERNMGEEITYSASIQHPQLGQLVWSLWEYPIGIENDYEVDVGPHELLENIEFGLGQGPPDDGEDKQSRIDELVEWFGERYEDPAERLPYISREGGYQWVFGGPYDAREVLSDEFVQESKEIINAAVKEIEAGGIYDWAPIAQSNDYEEEVLAENDLMQVVNDLAALIVDIPEPQIEPVFNFGEDGLLHLSPPPDQRPALDNGVLLEELRAATNDLRQSLIGTNAHTIILNAVEYYESAILEEPSSISRIYARGVRLDNASQTLMNGIEDDNLPSLPQNAEHYLNTTLELHHTYMMSHEEGRALAENAAAYRQSSQQTQRFREISTELANAVENASSLFSEEVRDQISLVVEEIGIGPQPERSNQVAETALSNLFSSLLKSMSGAGGIMVSAIVGGAVVTSVPGTEVIAGGSVAINAAWDFLLANASLLETFAAVAANDLTWLSQASNLLSHIKDIKGTDDTKS